MKYQVEVCHSSGEWFAASPATVRPMIWDSRDMAQLYGSLSRETQGMPWRVVVVSTDREPDDG